jgi:hypothetical protein
MVELEYFKICRGKGLNVGVEKKISIINIDTSPF